jgi:hypothetical protein
VAELAQPERLVNAQLRRAIEPLPQARSHSLQFFCECGCGDVVLLTIAEYDALDGNPVYRPGHPIAAVTAQPAIPSAAPA